MTRLKTAIVVTLVSILIWIFAEGESIRSATVGTRIRVQSPEGMALRVVEPDDFTGDAMLSLRGSTSGVDTIRDRLDDGITLDQTNGIPSAPGEHSIQLAALLRNSEVFADGGVSIDEVEPETIRLQLVPLERLTLPVVARVEAELEGSPEVQPESVTVRAPAALVQALPPDAAAVVALGADRVKAIPFGVPRTIRNVRVDLPPALRDQWGVRGPEPPTADVTVTLRDTTASAVIPRVPVHVRLATSELGRWDIQIQDPWIENVTIRGPSDLVQRVAASMSPESPPEGRVTVLAILPLGFEELEQGITAKQAEFVLQPASAGTLRFDAPDTTVRIRIQRADADAEEPPEED